MKQHILVTGGQGGLGRGEGAGGREVVDLVEDQQAEAVAVAGQVQVGAVVGADGEVQDLVLAPDQPLPHRAQRRGGEDEGPAVGAPGGTLNVQTLVSDLPWLTPGGRDE